MNSHVIINVPSLFILGPIASYSYHNAQTIPLSLPPVSQNLILLPVPSSQSAIRVCLTNSPLLLSLPFHPFPSCRIPTAPKAWQRICALTKKENLFPISAAPASYHTQETC